VGARSDTFYDGRNGHVVPGLKDPLFRKSVVAGTWARDQIAGASADFVDLIGRMLARHGRITADDAFRHPFFGVKQVIQTIVGAVDAALSDSDQQLPGAEADPPT
jgi:hypothetical protein